MSRVRWASRKRDDSASPERARVPDLRQRLQAVWERVRRRAGLEDLHFHDLRHEALSRLFEMGPDYPEVGFISGHRDPRMLFRYSHPMRQRMLQVIDSAPN